ncbi:MAG: cytochrome c [Actinomycetes bacterium]
MVRARSASVLFAIFTVVAAAFTAGVPAALSHPAAVTTTPIRGDVKAGKQLFVAACGGCHILKAAKTLGKRGPNLDQEPSAYAALITQITYGGEGMPGFAKAFKPAYIRDIAAFVARSTPYSGGGDRG